MNPQRSLAAFIQSKGKILLGKRKNLGDMAGKWELIGGKAEANETDKEALRRELKEELAIDVTVLELIDRDSFMHNGREHLLFVYNVLIEKDSFVLSEHDRVAWFDPLDLPPISDLVDSDARVLTRLLKRTN